jgi:hypothetical protein
MRKENRKKIHNQILDKILTLPPYTLFYQESGLNYIDEQGKIGEQCSLQDIAKLLKKAFGYNIPLKEIKVALQPLHISKNYYGKTLDK